MKHVLLNAILCSALLISAFANYSCKKDDDAADKDPTTTTGFCFSPSSTTDNYISLQGAQKAKRIDVGGWYFAEIDLGFEFPFCGENFSTVTCNPDEAFSTFTYDTTQGAVDMTYYEIHPFTGMFLTGSVNNISHQTTGTAGQKICKVQFDSFYVDDWGWDTDGYVSLQVWYHEKGKIEFHYGPITINADSLTGVWGNKGPAVGIIGKSAINSAFAWGDPTNVQSNKTNSRFLDRIPKSGEVIVFD